MPNEESNPPTDPAFSVSREEEEPPMLDVHPPHEPIHSWRDFLLHIATITIGLFIALSLEAGVEGLHHRHIVRESREQIRQEIEQNQQTVAADRAYLVTTRSKLREDLMILARLKDHPSPADAAKFKLLPWGWNEPMDTAFATARDSGALALMSYDDAHAYTLVYGQQSIVNQYTLRYLDHYREIGIPLIVHPNIGSLTPIQLDLTAQSIATALNDSEVLESLMDGLDRNYANVLREL